MKSNWFVLAALYHGHYHFLPFSGARNRAIHREFYIERFNWADATGQALATFVPSGGPDGSSYASSTFNISGSSRRRRDNRFSWSGRVQFQQPRL